MEWFILQGPDPDKFVRMFSDDLRIPNYPLQFFVKKLIPLMSGKKNCINSLKLYLSCLSMFNIIKNAIGEYKQVIEVVGCYIIHAKSILFVCMIRAMISARSSLSF